MGFKCLSKFNVALLAKQVWCVIYYLDSFLKKVVLSKFKFHERKIGELTIIYLEKFIVGKGLLENGMCWRVGLGKQI
ncbi:reverse transcriptase [Gossypium australe]|uniref:Reverse transcriptase n=1 Tax=Gossypium australe TaxID=47621 RepID=A0A5B6VUY2_9ROSI|nr:reverse transcriptase [Gossypium australe]